MSLNFEDRPDTSVIPSDTRYATWSDSLHTFRENAAGPWKSYSIFDYKIAVCLVALTLATISVSIGFFIATLFCVPMTIISNRSDRRRLIQIYENIESIEDFEWETPFAITTINIYDGQVVTGMDSGVLWVEDKRLHFNGLQTSFSLSIADVAVGIGAKGSSNRILLNDVGQSGQRSIWYQDFQPNTIDLWLAKITKDQLVRQPTNSSYLYYLFTDSGQRQQKTNVLGQLPPREFCLDRHFFESETRWFLDSHIAAFLTIYTTFGALPLLQHLLADRPTVFIALGIFILTSIALAMSSNVYRSYVRYFHYLVNRRRVHKQIECHAHDALD